MVRTWLFAPVCSLALCVATAAPAFAATYGMVIGVDRYETQKRLYGAVNDARDITQALRRFGARDVLTFENEQASRDELERAWAGLLQRAVRGDTIVLTVSAHGAQERDWNGDEATADQPGDIHDEAILLSRFDPNDATLSQERLLDDDLHEWFQAADAQGVRVVFVADTCYSGTLTRSATAQTRLADPYATAKPARQQRRRPQREEDFSNVVFISAGREAEIVIEVAIDGVLRGATSHAFARAIEGAADRNDDGVWTRDELATYVELVAHQETTQHTPALLPRGGRDFPVLVRENAGTSAKPLSRPAVPAPRLPGVMLDTGGRDLFWDPVTGDLKSLEGDQMGFAIAERDLPRLTDKFRLLETIGRAARRNPVAIELQRNGRRSNEVHIEGEMLDVAIGPISAPYVTIFNLSNRGAVWPVFPLLGDRSEEGPQSINRLLPLFEVTVTEPFGADHVVIVVTMAPPMALRMALAAPDVTAKKMKPLLDELAGKLGSGFGVHGFFTKERRR